MQADLSWIEFVKLLNVYKDTILLEWRWLPIVALVYSVIEGKHQVAFWIDGEDQHTRQQMQPQLKKLLFSSYLRRLLLWFLLLNVSWILFFHLL